MPPLITGHLWQAQIEAIQNLDKSLAENRPRALIQMATGSGKTFTAVNFVYRLIKHAGARRVLFLVDRGNLGDQTLKEFQQFTTPDDGRKFTELYNIQHLQSAQIDTVSRVTISTIQRLYSMLQGKELDPELDEVSGEGIASIFRDPLPVTYNPKVPIETFRVISETEFQQVTPDAKTKTHFVIVDAVGVCERDKSDSRPLEQKKSVPLDKLLEGIALGVREPDALSSLAGRLIRLEKRLDPELQAEVEKLAGGKKLSQIAQNLLDAIDPDYIEAKAKEGKSETYEPSEEELRNLRGSIANFAVAPIATDPGLRQKLIELQSAAEQTIDIISKDKLIFAGADARTAESARDTVRSFREYIEKHKAEIETLQILYSRPFHKRLTEETLRDFEAKLKPEFGPTPVESLWMAFEKSGSASSPSAPRSQTRRFTDLVSLVRVALEQEPVLQPFEEHVRSRFDEWIEMKRRDTRSLPQRWADANPDLVVGSRELVMNLTAQSLKDEFLGRVCLTEHGEKCLLNQRLARLTPVLVPPEYVLYLLKSWRFRRFVDGLNTGSLIQHMFTSQLARFTFPLPPISEQQRIIAEVDCRLSVIEELEAVVAANLKRAERLRQSILHSAFSGSLDP
jgi:hypothetical protein